MIGRRVRNIGDSVFISIDGILWKIIEIDGWRRRKLYITLGDAWLEEQRELRLAYKMSG